VVVAEGSVGTTGDGTLSIGAASVVGCVGAAGAGAEDGVDGGAGAGSVVVGSVIRGTNGSRLAPRRRARRFVADAAAAAVCACGWPTATGVAGAAVVAAGVAGATGVVVAGED
jgi:hypothetical protein